MSENRMLNGRYQLDELIGRGSIADVYLGQDLHLNRTVAVKLLRPDFVQDTQLQANFRREAQAVANLNHPAIVAVYDTGDVLQQLPNHESFSVPYLVMEYIAGETLRELIEHDRIGVDQAVGYTLDILAALEYSHQAGIIHRDLKPGNVMVSSERGAVKVTDFGIARAVTDPLTTATQSQAGVGSAQYRSPEQAQGERIDSRSDLYSAACLLYEMLTGRPPFVGTSAASVAHQHVSERPEEPSHYNPDVVPQLDQVVLRALEKDRVDRFQDAAAFRQALQNFHTSEGAVHAYTDVMPMAQNGAYPQESSFDTSTRSIPAAQPEAAMQESAPYENPDYREHGSTARAKRKRRAWIVTLILASLLLLAGGGYLLYNTLLSKPNTPTVAVPPVAGMSENEALSALFNAKLRSRSQQIFNDVVKPGIVVASDPGAGTRVPTDSPITLQISKGPANVTVPQNLVGMTEAAARDVLRSLGLNPGVTNTADDPKIPQGGIISTSPAGKAQIPAGSTVDLTISSGHVKMISVYGKNQRDATQALAGISQRLTLKFVEEDNSQVPPGTVISQTPEPGIEINPTAQITLHLARTPASPSPSQSPRNSSPENQSDGDRR